MATNGHDGFVTLGVSPDLRATLREQRDDLGFNSYEALIRAMNEQYDPEEREY